MSELWTIQVVFFEKSIIQPPWPKRKPLLRRLFRGKRKGTGWLSLHPIRTFQFNKKSDPTMWDHFFWRKERASLRYPSPKNSPPDCFYSRNFVSAAGSFESPSFQFNKKSDPTMWDHFFGGKRGIRTLGAFIGHTRFPVVRLRPAQPSFHNGFCCVHSTRKCLIIISGRSKKVKHFLEKNGEIFRRVDGQPKV